MAYSDKLKDPRWQKKRLEIMIRDDFTCQKCGSRKRTLHIHHKEYNGKDPWDIDNNLLLVLCEKCHNKIDKEKNVFNSQEAWEYISSHSDDYDVFEFVEESLSNIFGWDGVRVLEFLFELHASDCVDIIYDSMGYCLIKINKMPKRFI